MRLVVLANILQYCLQVSISSSVGVSQKEKSRSTLKNRHLKFILQKYSIHTELGEEVSKKLKELSINKRLLTTAETLVNTSTSGSQDFAKIAKLTNGNLIVTWTNIDAGGTYLGITAQIIDSSAAKIGSEFKVSTTGGAGDNERHQSVFCLAGGNIAVAWIYTTSNTYAVVAQIIDNTGNKIGPEITVSAASIHVKKIYTSSCSYKRWVCCLMGGRYV